MPQRLNTVRNRLLLLFFLITSSAAGFIYLYVVPQLESSLTTEKLSRLEESGSEQIGRLERAMDDRASPSELAAMLRLVSEATDSRVTVIGVREAGGSAQPAFVIGDSSLESATSPSGFELAAGAVSGSTAAGTDTLDGERTAEVAIPLGDEEPPRWIAVFSEPLGEVEENVALIRRQILIAAAIALALAMLAGFYAARALSRRLSRLEEAAQKVADGDFDSPIPIDSSDELGQLARTFNDMQRRLAELDSARKQFIANASHELRTPIFSLGGFIELLDTEDPDPEVRAEFVRTMREQVERLTKLTADLLDLSKLDAGAMLIDAEQFDLAQVTREVVREFGPIADRHGSRMELRTSEEPVPAHADPERTRQIIRILIDNALTHTPEGTKLTVTTLNQDATAETVVSDEGPGIAKREAPRVFDRFYTGDLAGGSGLGLAIGRELAHRMEGELSLSSGKGFTAFVLTLPQSAARETRPAPAGEALA